MPTRLAFRQTPLTFFRMFRLVPVIDRRLKKAWKGRGLYKFKERDETVVNNSTDEIWNYPLYQGVIK